MSIGARRERIQIKRKVRVKRTDGGFDTTLSVVAARWASLKPIRRIGDTETEIAGALRGTVRYLIEVDSRGADVRTDDIIIWTTNGDLMLNVRDVRAPMGRTLPLEIVAESGVPNGGA